MPKVIRVQLLGRPTRATLPGLEVALRPRPDAFWVDIDVGALGADQDDVAWRLGVLTVGTVCPIFRIAGFRLRARRAEEEDCGQKAGLPGVVSYHWRPSRGTTIQGKWLMAGLPRELFPLLANTLVGVSFRADSLHVRRKLPDLLGARLAGRKDARI